MCWDESSNGPHRIARWLITPQLMRRAVSQRTASSYLRRALLSVAPILAISCTVEPSEGNAWELRRGIVDFSGDPIVIEHADTFALGTGGSVAVRTYGGGCIRQGVSEVAVSGLTAVIEPFDSVHIAAQACTRELRLFRHVVAVRFTERGSAILRIVGVSHPADDEIIVTRHVVVH
jgi:hypothetical protein